MSAHLPMQIRIPSAQKVRANQWHVHATVCIFIVVNLLSAHVLAADRWLVAMANPAAVACKEAGGQINKMYTDKGEQGMCTLPSGLVCEEWAFFKGVCGQDKLPVAVPAPVYSDILLDRVQHCIDTNKPGYCQQCQAPRASAACKTDNACKQTTEVWAETAEFVAIRDIKMCGCPSGFVHGLVLPRATVTGIEDDRRPDAIWPLAWQVALEHMNASEIALAVNSKSRRSQNQLHVHIVRLQPDAQAKLQAQTLRTTNDLNDVWRVAQQAATERHLSEYGVLVTTAPSGGYWVVVTQDSPEALFTQAVCRP